jgi:hypothetical protein
MVHDGIATATMIGSVARCLVTISLLLAWVLAGDAARAADMSHVYDAALGGDMTQALSILESIDRTRMTARDSTLADCIRATFKSPPRPEDLPPRSRDILSAYRGYWQTVMLHREPVAEAETHLLRDLKEILSRGSTDTTSATDLEVASERAKAAIEGEGLHALTGVTSPFWELMIWRTQTPETYHVKLPQRAIDVRVVFLDQFVSLGWAGYATCGRSHTGGWATKEALYALRSSYDTSTEDFRVSYLAHEGCHFSDYERFPQLEQPELEYRAKLTEIALSSETTLRLIQAFAQRIGHDRAVPHSLANYCVARDLSRALLGSEAGAGDAEKWTGMPAERLRQESLKLLKENDAQLQRMGSKEVKQFLVVSAKDRG